MFQMVTLQDSNSWKSDAGTTVGWLGGSLSLDSAGSRGNVIATGTVATNMILSVLVMAEERG